MNKSMILALYGLQVSIFEDSLEGSHLLRLLAFGFNHVCQCMFLRFSFYDKYTKVAISASITCYQLVRFQVHSYMNDVEGLEGRDIGPVLGTMIIFMAYWTLDE